jgi:2-hydroxycyclohexanecarboxyl-CoA dehydrogenase
MDRLAMERLEKQGQVVTGAAGAIGRGICLRFAEKHALVAALDRDLERARETAELVSKAGGRGIALGAARRSGSASA